MELIDRAALLDILCSGCTKYSGGICRNEYGRCAEYTIIKQVPTIPDIDRAAILRLLNEIEADATTIAYLSDNQQVFDCSHAILDRVELIGKELTGDDSGGTRD